VSRGIHSKPNRGATDEWLTPPELVGALGPFDLDPCAHPDQFYRTAARMICPPDDGMAAVWGGLVWLNPPFSQMQTWLPKLAAHGSGIALAAARTEVERWFWPYIWEAADAMLFLRGRLYFRRPDGSKRGNAGHGSVLAAYGPVARDRLKAAADLGRFLDLRKQ
jgi:hypothetical protein